MKKEIVLLLSLFLIYGCGKKTKDSEKEAKSITVKLDLNKNLGPFDRFLMPFASTNKEEIKSLKGIPELDTLSVQMLRMYSLRDLNEKLKNKEIDSFAFKNFIYGIYAVAGFKEGKQILYIDANNNKDFSDEEEIVFNRDFRLKTSKNIEIIDSLKLHKIISSNFYKKKIVTKTSHIKVFPYKDYFSFNNPTDEIKNYNNLHIVGQYNQHYTGSIDVSSKRYKIALQQDYGRTTIFVAEENKPYKPTIKGVYTPTYKLNDTIKFDKLYYKIDSLNITKKLLYLSLVDKKLIKFGRLKGEKIKNFTLQEISGDKKKLYDLLNEKDYILFDFWGTWCGPCIKLTPDLKKVYEKNTNIEIVGVAYDFDEKNVKKYISDNDLKWTQVFEKRKFKDTLKFNKIVGQLKVVDYPTYIIVNKQRKILYRGYGKNALDSIKLILNKTSNSF